MLGHPGPHGDALHGDARGALLDEQVVGRLRHGRPGLLAPAVPVAVMRPFRTGCHLAPLGREFTPEGGRESVEDALRRMSAQAEQDDAVAERIDWGSGPKPMSPQEHADAAAEICLPVSAAGGELLHSPVRAVRPATVVGFGMSYGISTLRLAAAVWTTARGRSSPRNSARRRPPPRGAPSPRPAWTT
ncbi:hypothetical protein AB0D38_15485 [Streptomyces sp. NPDC048279]|uniref:hypothetical protein n=1 Tax=Streptomyces sp. NPDC048279 TaxID=3154714 RepID=UPI00342E74A9